jgi:hypothetical protein
MSWREKSSVVGSTKDEENENGFVRGTLDVLQQLPRQAGLTARNIVTGVTGIPGMFADVAMSGVNLALPQNMQQQMPSQALQNLMTQAGLPEAQTGLERGLGMVQAGMAGSRVDPLVGTLAGLRTGRVLPPPGPQTTPGAGPLAPQQANLQNLGQQTFQEGREQGYVLPPASIRQDAPTQIIESLGGKRLTAELASQRNQDVTNRLAARSIGLSENQPLTANSLKAVRDEAGSVYQQIRDSGRIAADPEYQRDIAAVAQEISDISEDFVGANVGARQEIMDMVKSLNQSEFGANAAVTYLRKLRDTASKNIKAQEPERNDLGLAQRAAATALENAILRHLRRVGREDLASEFSQARTTIAKAHDIEAATDFATGNVNAAKFARLLSRGEPLSGELELIARMGAAFPQATRAPTSSAGVSALDIYGGVGTAGLGLMAQSPELAAVGVAMPFMRRGAIGGMLSSPVQNVLTRQYPQIPGRVLGATGGLLAAEDEEEQRRRLGLMQ